MKSNKNSFTLSCMNVYDYPFTISSNDVSFIFKKTFKKKKRKRKKTFSYQTIRRRKAYLYREEQDMTRSQKNIVTLVGRKRYDN